MFIYRYRARSRWIQSFRGMWEPQIEEITGNNFVILRKEWKRARNCLLQNSWNDICIDELDERHAIAY